MANLITKGLSRGTVEELSRQKGEPEWMLQKRLHAWDVYEKTPAPLGRRGDLGILLITHYQRILNYITPDFVHVMFNGRIVKSGGKELAFELEDKGYEWLRPAEEESGVS